ncbi:MAG: EAL domain-containing protein [Gammaproteobacteria bacterium]|nr:EAL domain-containing protein [Gammaproteobacteria bacterium]
MSQVDSKSSPLLQQIHADQVRMAFEGMPLAILAIAINSVVLGAVSWPAIDHTVILSWIGTVWIISGFRLLTLTRFHRLNPTNDRIGPWSRLSMIGALLSGVTWGAASLLLFDFDSIPHQAFLALVIAGMAAGAVTTLSAQRRAAIGFILASLLPLFYRLTQAEHELSTVMSLLVLMFMVMMIHLANRSYRNLAEMLCERHERKTGQQRDRNRNKILELVAKGASSHQILETIANCIEREYPGMICSILLLDESGRHLMTGAAPSLPDFYNDAIHGVMIGPGVGSCGTAAYTRKRVIVGDIQNHPYWIPYRELAAEANLGSCWSEPIASASGRVLGTLAIYHHEPHEPTGDETASIEQIAKLTGIVLERSKADEALQLAGLVYQNSSEAVMITDENNNIVAVNPAFTDITGYGQSEVIGKNPRILSSGRQSKEFYKGLWHALETQGHWQGEMVNRHKDSGEFTEWMTINTIYDDMGKVHRRVALFTDISERKKADKVIWQQANYDTLTGLPNRRLFIDRLEHGLRNAKRKGHSLALLFIDLDRFKEVNDTLGHHVGDELLVEASLRIKACVRESDTIARLGGDEFTVVLTQVTDETCIDRIAQRIIQSLSEPFELRDEKAYVSASIGVTVYPDDAATASDLLRTADQAMFAAKHDGRNRYSYFTNSMQEASQHRMRLIRDIHQALILDQFSVHYQPIVKLSTGEIVKAEALVRWKHPEHGFVSPAAFIPIAEDTGTIHEIGNRVFRAAAQQVSEWRERYNPRLQIGVNKSPAQFMAEGLNQDDWLTYLEELELAGDGIVIEITEGLLLKSAAHIDEKLLRLRDAGIQVAIDDFGTGYSSLAYLKRFDIDYLKIDQSFVRNLETDASDLALSEAIVVMAHKLGFQVIAEGVETEGQLKILEEIGCDYAQGYLFSKPVPAEDFEMLLRTWSPTRELVVASGDA